MKDIIQDHDELKNDMMLIMRSEKVPYLLLQKPEWKDVEIFIIVVTHVDIINSHGSDAGCLAQLITIKGAGHIDKTAVPNQ